MAPISRPPYDAITKPENAARFDGRQITQMTYKANGQAQFIPGPATAPRPPQQPEPAQIFIERPGAQKKAITNTKYSHREAVVSPDGKWIAFVADTKLRSDSLVTAERDSAAKLPPDRKRDEMLRNDSEIYLLSVSACESSSACEPRKIEYAGNESQISWSPDSRQIAFVGQPGRFKNQRLFVVAADGGKPQDILGTWAYEPGQIQWLKSGSIIMQTTTGGARGVYSIDPSSKKISTILGGRRVVSSASLDASQSRIFFVATDMTHPTELFVANADGSNEKKLTSFNDKVNAEVAWADAEEFAYPSVGGLKVEGWLMKPMATTRQRSTRSSYTSTAVRTRTTTKVGSTSSRTSPARGCSCCSRILADQRHEHRVHLREPRRLGWQGLR